MKRILLSLFLLSLAAAPVRARDWWTSPTALDTGTGADAAHPTSLNNANASAQPGDNVRMLAGDYSVNTGNGDWSCSVYPYSSGTLGNRITYMGVESAPTAVIVNKILFTSRWANEVYLSYITAKWMTVAGDEIKLSTSSGGYSTTTRDSIHCITAANIGSGGIGCWGVSRSLLDSLTITANLVAGYRQQLQLINFFGGANNSTPFTTAGYSWQYPGAISDTVRDCSFTVRTSSSASPGDIQVLRLTQSFNNVIYNNTWDITVPALGITGYWFAVELYHSTYNSFQKNTWNIHLNGPMTGTLGVWSHRDSSSYNRWVNNTVTVDGSGPGTVSFILTNGGSWTQSTNHNYYGGNVIKCSRPNGPLFNFFEGARYDTVEFNTIASEGSAALGITPANDWIGAIVRHNTFYTSGATAVDISAAAPVSGSPRFVSNVYYGRTVNAHGSELLRVPAGVALDSAGVFFAPAGSAANAIGIAGTSGTPGSGSGYGASGKSVWGSPQFRDSLTAAGLKDSLLAGSYAKNANLSDGYAGSKDGTAITSPTASSVTLTSNFNPCVYGGRLTLTATVVGSGATGSVRLVDNGVALGTAYPVLPGASGIALFFPRLAVGTHSLVATYSGDATYAGSSSSTLTQSIGSIPTPEPTLEEVDPLPKVRR